MNIYTNCSLLHYNTFGIQVRADMLVEYESVGELKQALALYHERMGEKPLLHIGGGSNLLFLCDFKGMVLHSLVEGYKVVGEEGDDVLVRVGAGMTFDDFVSESLWRGWYGLENLSGIPGQVGASAVQNVGAYGTEVGSLIEKVEGVSLSDGSQHSWKGAECGYAYRQSIFKQELAGQYAITYVTYRLHRTFRPQLEYGGVRQAMAEAGFSEDTLTAMKLRQVILFIRRQKLPDPAIQGNAGSFFMNPVVSKREFDSLCRRFPGIPGYRQGEDAFKVPAAWLIEQCGWKGRRWNDSPAAVHDRQPLVLVNKGGARGTEILHLCEDIQTDVKKKFGIELRHEVNIVAPEGDLDDIDDD